MIRDNRRIDPVTGQPRRGKHAASSRPAPRVPARPGPGLAARQGRRGARHRRADEVSPTEGSATDDGRPRRSPPDRAAASQLQSQLAERTADLQRLQAEYANYRKRVDRDRATVREHAVAGALTELLPVLDAIGQAREHGELSGGFKSVADSLQAAVGKLGLVSYGAARRRRSTRRSTRR